jgi:uncharacterized protein YceK
MRVILLPLVVAVLTTSCAVTKSEVTMKGFPASVTAVVMDAASENQADACVYGVEKDARKANVRTKNGRAHVEAKSTVRCY